MRYSANELSAQDRRLTSFATLSHYQISSLHSLFIHTTEPPNKACSGLVKFPLIFAKLNDRQAAAGYSHWRRVVKDHFLEDLDQRSRSKK